LNTPGRKTLQKYAQHIWKRGAISSEIAMDCAKGTTLYCREF
jgi:hypothetical protein